MNCPRCRRPISEHEAGVETDACVAEVVMRWTSKLCNPYPFSDGVIVWVRDNLPAVFCPAFSTDISAAWEVRAKLIEKGYGVCGAWSPVPQCEDWNVWDSRSGLVTVPAQASTAPLAICRLGLEVAAGEVGAQ